MKTTVQMILDVYDVFLRQEEVQKAAAALGITPKTLLSRISKCPHLKKAKALADERRGNTQTFSGYIFGRLSPEARDVWNRVRQLDKKGAADQIEVLLGSKPRALRQQLFIHALVCTNFDQSTACRMVNIPRSTLECWRRDDLEFQQLVEEIQWHKKNFFERALVDLVELRHPSAVVFVNKTVNGDRGYREKVEVEHSGKIETGFGMDDLDLDVETKRKVLEAIRKKNAGAQAAAADNKS